MFLFSAYPLSICLCVNRTNRFHKSNINALIVNEFSIPSSFLLHSMRQTIKLSFFLAFLSHFSFFFSLYIYRCFPLFLRRNQSSLFSTLVSRRWWRWMFPLFFPLSLDYFLLFPFVQDTWNVNAHIDTDFSRPMGE